MAYKKWSKEEEEQLRNTLNGVGADYLKAMRRFSSETGIDFKRVYNKASNTKLIVPNANRTPWSSNEDAELINTISRYNGNVRKACMEFTKTHIHRTPEAARSRWSKKLRYDNTVSIYSEEDVKKAINRNQKPDKKLSIWNKFIKFIFGK